MECNQQFTICILGLFVLIQNAESASRIDPLVDTKVGLIRGLRATDGEYAMFMGIPYAYINELNPFGVSKPHRTNSTKLTSLPHTRFDGTFEAFDNSAICPQKSLISGEPIGSLDCLHLNVYVPNVASSVNRLPVMVYIHGGGFEMGNFRQYRPTYLVRHGVIIVTINYRVGPYGFMCLDTPEVPGNQGLKDQHLALKWVKNNIEAFGGDFDQITIFGESAGGASVDLHLIFSEENLYHKAIMQSGSSLSIFGIQEADSLAAYKLATHLGLETNDLMEALSFLSAADTKLVTAASTELSLVFRPCVEKAFDNVETFIYDHPINLNLPRPKNIPILAGFNNQESLAWVLTRNPEEQRSLIMDYIKIYFTFKDEDIAGVEELVRHFYVGDDEINEASIYSMVDFDSDFIFNYPITRSIKTHLDNGAPAIYQYMFSYNGGNNFGKHNLNITFGGAAHADELGYLFPVAGNENPTAEDQLIIDRITTLWTNFAKYGNPTPETSDLLPVAWPQLTEDKLPYMNIDSEIRVESRPFHDRIAFWDLFFKLYYKAQRGYRDEE